MDDEAAEIELVSMLIILRIASHLAKLEQNLNKTHQISQRMITTLSSFDTRLIKLEKSILPLHNATQLLFRRSASRAVSLSTRQAQLTVYL